MQVIGAVVILVIVIIVSGAALLRAYYGEPATMLGTIAMAGWSLLFAGRWLVDAIDERVKGR